ncbi:MAG: hypothetical protein AAF583_05285 [Pseudomonadota bacterium]
MIWNIVDNRKRKYRWVEINAVIENTEHDNSCEDTDFCEPQEDAVTYEQRKSILLHDAIVWAEQATGKVTLYLYDKGDGIH